MLDSQEPKPIGTIAASTEDSQSNLDGISTPSNQSRRGLTVQEALTTAGGFGRYQCFLLLTMILANNGPGLVVYGVAYYELAPPYICTYNMPQYVGHQADPFLLSSDNEGENTALYSQNCDTDVVCGKDGDKYIQNTSMVSYKIDTESLYYIQNWVEQLNLHCVPKEYIGLVGAMAFAGVAISCLFIPTLGDKYGRHLCWVCSLFLQLPLYLGANLTDHIAVAYVMCFYLGMGLIGRFTCGFVLLTESFPKKNQAIGGATSMIGDVVATLYITFFLRYIDNSAKALIWIGFAINIVAFIFSLWIVESPSWLASVGRKEEAIKNLKYIAKVNGTKDFQLDEIRDTTFETVDPEKEKEQVTQSENDQENKENTAEIEEIGNDNDKLIHTQDPKVQEQAESSEMNKKKNPTGFCQDKSLLINLILMTCIWTAASFCYYIITFFLKYIPGNVYTNTSLSCIAEIIAYMCSGLVIDKFGVKISYVISFSLASLGGILMVIFFNAEGILIAVFVLFARFGIAFAFNLSYLATPRMFPTALTTTAFGICNLFARMATIMSPLVAELPNPIPMSTFTVICLASVFIPLFLRTVKQSE